MMLCLPRPFPVLATILALCGVLVLLSLGHWQQERLVWKTNLQTKLDREFAKDAATSPLSKEDLDSVTPMIVKRGLVSGRLDYKKQIILRGQIADGKAVNYIVIPLTLKDDSTLFVVAGSQEKSGTLSSPSKRSKSDVITGIARIPQWSRFVPENEPDKDLWYRADIAEMAAARKISNVIPALFYLETSAVNLGVTPVEVPRVLRNDHRQYMMFWYTMAVVLIGIYILRFWRTPSEG